MPFRTWFQSQEEGQAGSTQAGATLHVGDAQLSAAGTLNEGLLDAALTASATVGADLTSAGVTNFLGGFGPTVEGQPQSQAVQRGSLLFDTTDFLETSEVALGVANAWSIVLWLKWADDATSHQVFGAKPASSSENQIFLSADGAVANDPFRVLIRDSSAAIIKDFDWEGVLVQDEWTMVVVTWDGTDLKLYRNGEDEGAQDVTRTDTTGTMTDSPSRKVFIGSANGGGTSFDGNGHSAAMYDVALSANEVRQMWNQGAGAWMNLQLDQDDYSSSADLQHWWRLGHDAANIGEDFEGTLDAT